MAVGEGSASSEPDDNANTAATDVDSTSDSAAAPTTVEPKPIEESEPVTPPRQRRDAKAAREDHDGHAHESSEGSDGDEDEEDEEDDDEEEEEEEEEPRLKYAPLTKNLGEVYRNGDATSAFLVAGDKLIIGTHNGKIHVYGMPTLQSIKRYGPHSASVSSVSISPFPPPFPVQLRPEPHREPSSLKQATPSPTNSPAPKSTPKQTPVSRSPSNDIYIATSSIDGHVCVQSLVDSKDVQRRNFGRPVQAVALSPEFKSDKSYLSGGQAGSLILTVGGQVGRSVDATVTGTAAAASGWLGSIGLGHNTGSDKVIHSGEGTISTIRWSLSGKYVLWVNEYGIKIARSHLKLEASESSLEWKRISHVPRPDKPGWDEMAAVHRARAEWVDKSSLDSDDDPALRRPPSSGSQNDKSSFEEAVIGWGDRTWIIRVYPGDSGSMSKAAAPAGRAEVVSIIKFDDCIIAGVALFTPTLLLVLAYMEKKSSKKVKNDSTPRSRSKRHNGLKPELRLIDIESKEEIETDALPVSRFESLSFADYHLSVLYPIKIPPQLMQKGYLSQIGSGAAAVGSGLVTGTEVVAQGMWDATMYGPRMLGANRLFSSDAVSVRSGRPGTDKSPLPPSKGSNYLTGWIPGFGSSLFGSENEDLRAVATTQGMKIFLMSPYDCIVAIKRGLSDRVQWLEEQEQYQKAWELLRDHPEAAGTAVESSGASSPPTPSKASSFAHSAADSISSPVRKDPLPTTLAEFFDDTPSLAGSSQANKNDKNSNAEKEKRRIGELWLQQLIKADDWSEAGEVAARVLNTTSRWEHWVRTFIKKQKFDEIAPHIPAMELQPPLPASIFESVLEHYVSIDVKRFKELVDIWPSDLFDIGTITTAINYQLDNEVKKDSDAWRLLKECLAKLYLADGDYRDALKCYIQLQDADTAMSLVKDHHLVEAIADDVPGFVLLKISRQQIKTSSQQQLEELSAEPIKLLVDEASHGSIELDEVVRQLNKPDLKLFLFFYLRMLWQGTGGSSAHVSGQRHRFSTAVLAADEGKMLVDQHPQLAVELFAEYDRKVLMDFLQTSTIYDFSSALKICEKKKYIEEEVFLLSKTGSLKKALYLIIDELKDVSKAIQFAKEQDDHGLWEDLLDYSMSRPRFISGLLAEVGTAIDPITLVKRIPSGIEIQGLKDGLRKMLREYDLQDSISSGAAKILSSEVAVNMDILRRGRRRGIKFDLPSHKGTTSTDEEEDLRKPGHCAICDKPFGNEEAGTLVAFACGHVYHVDCLFEPTTKTTDDDDEGNDFAPVRAVGPKVTNARLLRDRIKMLGGCKVCSERQRMIDDVVQ